MKNQKKKNRSLLKRFYSGFVFVKKIIAIGKTEWSETTIKTSKIFRKDFSQERKDRLWTRSSSDRSLQLFSYEVNS